MRATQDERIHRVQQGLETTIKALLLQSPESRCRCSFAVANGWSEYAVVNDTVLPGTFRVLRSGGR